MPRAAQDQPDLFAEPLSEPAPEQRPEMASLLPGMRAEAAAMLALARGAARLPWRDYTAATVAELRFDGLIRWLPEAEREALGRAFAAELDRLYAAEPGR